MYKLDLQNNSIAVHFIGIGGISMSGIAELFLDKGFKVSGSDLHESREFDNLNRYEVHQSQIWLIFLSNLKFILARSTPIRYNSIGG